MNVVLDSPRILEIKNVLLIVCLKEQSLKNKKAETWIYSHALYFFD